MTYSEPKRHVARARRTLAAARTEQKLPSRLAALRAPTLVLLVILLIPVLGFSLRGSWHPTELGLTVLIAAFGVRGLWRTYRGSARKHDSGA